MTASNMSLPQIERTRSKLKIIAAALPVLLTIGLWSTRGEPLLARAVGAAVNISFTLWTLYLLRKSSRTRGTH